MDLASSEKMQGIEEEYSITVMRENKRSKLG
jgi:hypothetical protein